MATLDAAAAERELRKDDAMALRPARTTQIILDGDCLRDAHGRVTAWIRGDNVYTLKGRHVGWFEAGALCDSSNRPLGFLPDASGHLTGRPGLAGF